MNPNKDDSTRQWISDETLAIEGGTVITATTHTEGDDTGHFVEVEIDSFDEPTIADVRVDQQGDVSIPTEGSRVIVAHRTNGRPLVLGTRYAINDAIPPYEPGERRVGHPTTDSNVTFENDGTVRVEGDGGNTVTLKPNGDVIVNGGSTQPIVDISTSTDSDGHVTSINTTRADGVYLPSQ